MKRPLFWAVVMFALGEVIYITVSKPIQISMLYGMLICVGGVIAYRRKKAVFLIVGLFVLLGFLNIFRSSCRGCDDTFFKGEVAGKIVKINESEDSRSAIIKGEDGCKVMLFKLGENNLRVGQRVMAKGEKIEFSKPRNPGGFDQKKYYFSKGVCYGISCESVVVLDEKYNLFQLFISKAGATGKDRISKICPEDARGILSAVLFGDKGAIDTGTLKIYQMSGISHVLAISGLHVSIVCGFTYFVLKKMYVPAKMATVITIGVVICYGALAGFRLSTVRAIVMVTVALFGDRIGRSFDMLTGLAVAVFLMLVINPGCILDTGMILSCGAIFGVCVGLRMAKSYKNKRGKKRRVPIWDRFIESVIVSLGISITTMPLSAMFFYEVPAYGVFLNIIVVPGMTFVVGLGFLSVLVSFLSVGAAKVTVFPAVFLLRKYLTIAKLYVRLPGSVLNIGKLPVWAVICYYSLLAIFITAINIRNRFGDRLSKVMLSWIRFLYSMLGVKKRPKEPSNRYVRLVLAAFSLILMVPVVAISVADGEELFFFDVGQGDFSAIRTNDGKVIVIDCGSSSKEPDKLFSYDVEGALKSRRLAHVDCWVATHSDKDHINGLEYILENYEYSGIKIDSIIVPAYATKEEGNYSGGEDSEFEHVTMLAKKRRIKVIKTYAGMCLRGKDYQLKCIHPDVKYAEAGCETKEDPNDTSLCFDYRSSRLRAVYLADVPTAAISYMIDSKKLLFDRKIDYLKLPHHGSKYSISDELYQHLGGVKVVISCAKNSIYGHPHKETIDMLKLAGANIMRTDKIGAIIGR